MPRPGTTRLSSAVWSASRYARRSDRMERSVARMAAMPAASMGLALLVGVLAVQWMPSLPPRWCTLLLLALASLPAWRWPRGRWVGCILIGVAWAMFRGGLAMDARLPRSLEGRDLIVTGTIVDLPLKRDYASSFELRVDRATLDGRLIPWRGRVAASWYDDGIRDAIARGIAARVRDQHDAALLRAFAVGDTRGLQQRDWAVARANGVSHLIAISGFHVGVAAVFGLGLAALLYRLLPQLGHRLPRPQAQAAAALLAATIYSALAGFGLPTVRTLLMIAVVTLARCGRRGSTGAQSL